jgi:hypothetical protein
MSIAHVIHGPAGEQPGTNSDPQTRRSFRLHFHSRSPQRQITAAVAGTPTASGRLSHPLIEPRRLQASSALGDAPIGQVVDVSAGE